MKNFKKVTLALLLAALLVITCACGTTTTQTPETMDADVARDWISVKADKINTIELAVRIDRNEQFHLDLSHEFQMLPDISEYPFVVNPMTASYITVYSDNPTVIQAAIDFNNAAVTVDGEPVSIGVRPVPTDIATNFILAKKYTPDVLIPRSEIYGNILAYNGVPVSLISDSTARGISGVVVSDKAGVSNFSDLVRKIHDGELTIGYVDPLQDPDALNFILSVLYEYDSTQPLGEVAMNGLRQVQRGVTLPAYESSQLMSTFLRGIIGSYVLDYATFKSTPDFATGYTFIPFGVPQSHPIYTVGELSEIKTQIAKEFAKYCEEAGQKATIDEIVSGYTSDISVTPAIAGELSIIYKSVQGGGASSVTAVFVVDVSGSMRGTPLLRVKTGLRGAISSAISPNNNIGLITFDDRISIAVPIGPFDGERQSYFSNALNEMTDGGTTAMFSAITVGLDELIRYQQEHDPNTKLVLFVLTDGDDNASTIKFDAHMEAAIAGSRIPIYTIGYESEDNGLQTDVLVRLSAINEASFIDAQTENIVYILSSLLGSQLN